MSLLLIAMALGQTNPGPLDAFRANLAATRVKVRFECLFYDRIDYSSISRQLEQFSPGPGPASEPSYIAQGRWDFDGSCEHYVIRITGGSKHDPNGRTGPLPAFELIWDDNTYAYHYLMPGESALHLETKIVRPPLFALGPFTWKRRYRFDREHDAEHSNAEVEHKIGERGGRRLEIEIYRMKREGSQLRKEVAYDPEIGYIPRYLRTISFGMEKGRGPASVLELYVTDAQLSGTGGFVPTKWYLVAYHVSDFASKYPGYNDETRLTPSDTPQLTHLRVLKMEGQEGPVKLDEMEGVKQIMAPGGGFGSKDGLPPMSVSELKRLLGKKSISSNKPALSNIDYAELHEFDRPKARTPWLSYILGGLVVIASLWCLRAWRGGRAALVVFWALAITGCAQPAIPRVTAAFSPSCLIYDAAQPSLQIGLVVNNAGNRPLRIFSVDAGCSCRQVEKAQLPASLRPGEKLELSMSLSGQLPYNLHPYILTFHTDLGQLATQATLLALPDHRLSPQSVTMQGLYEGTTETEDSFEVIHRAIYDPSASRPGTELNFPPEFIAQKTATHTGRVADAPDYAFEDTTYRLTLNDRTLGLHRADILLRGADGRRIITTPIVWQRLPFLSSTPSRVALATQPVRTFLRCPDEDVELVRVLSAPKGVKAVLGSPREVVISPGENAPEVIDGVVEVETTAKGRSPLRIAVVRYAPLASRR